MMFMVRVRVFKTFLNCGSVSARLEDEQPVLDTKHRLIQVRDNVRLDLLS